MPPLTPRQRAILRRLAHPLRATVLIGKQGLSDSVLTSVDQVLLAHELVKVKFVGNKVEKDALAERLAGATHSHLVAVIGNTALFYRPHPQKVKRKISL